MSSVSAQNLVVTHSGYPAIADASFELPKHHFAIVTGENGSGKTTLLKAISGTMEILRGTLTVSDDEFSASYGNARLLRRLAIYVGHNALYMRHINVIEHLNLCSVLDRSNLSKKPDWVLSVDEVIERFNLGLRTKVRVENLSAGQQRRLHLASALVRNANLLCIDEPHASLDEKSKQMFDEIVSEQFESGRSFIVATHDPSRLQNLATHEIEILNGVTKLTSSQVCGDQ